MRTAAFLILLAALRAAADDDLELPVAAHADQPVEAWVGLAATGEVHHRGERVSLDRFTAALHEAALRDVGEVAEGGPRASRLRLRIRADARAPWRHVQWLLQAAAECRVYRTEFVVRRDGGGAGVLEAWLPVDAGVHAGGGPDERVRVRLVAEGARAAKFGPAGAVADVEVPEATAFVLGERRTKDPKELALWLAEEIATRSCGGTSLAWEIAADARVPFGDVVKALDALRGTGVEGVEFHGAPPPSPEVRARDLLLYPSE